MLEQSVMTAHPTLIPQKENKNEQKKKLNIFFPSFKEIVLYITE